MKKGIWQTYREGQLHREDRYDQGEVFLENYWDDGKQTVRNGRGYVDKIVRDSDDDFSYTIRIRTWIRNGLEKGSSQKVLRKERLKKSDQIGLSIF